MLWQVAGGRSCLARGVIEIAGAGERNVSGLLPIATRMATAHTPGSLHYAGADCWVSMPNGAQGSFSRGRSSVEAGPTPVPW
jgi:hypothetical protein